MPETDAIADLTEAEAADLYEWLHVPNAPGGIADRADWNRIPTSQQHEVALSGLAVAHMAATHTDGGDSLVSFDEVSYYVPRLAARYGRSVGCTELADALWCGLPELVGHIMAAAVAEHCRVVEPDDEMLGDLVEALVGQLWGDRTVGRGQALHHALALRRHGQRYGYLNAGGIAGLDELARVGQVDGGRRLVGIHHLVRRVAHQCGNDLALRAAIGRVMTMAIQRASSGPGVVGLGADLAER
jgi:hypothetical protein